MINKQAKQDRDNAAEDAKKAAQEQENIKAEAAEAAALAATELAAKEKAAAEEKAAADKALAAEKAAADEALAAEKAAAEVEQEKIKAEAALAAKAAEEKAAAEQKNIIAAASEEVDDELEEVDDELEEVDDGLEKETAASEEVDDGLEKETAALEEVASEVEEEEEAEANLKYVTFLQKLTRDKVLLGIVDAENSENLKETLENIEKFELMSYLGYDRDDLFEDYKIIVFDFYTDQEAQTTRETKQEYIKMKKYPSHHSTIQPLARGEMKTKLTKLDYKDDYDVIIDMMEIKLIKEYAESDDTMAKQKKIAQDIFREYRKSDEDGAQKLFFDGEFFYANKYHQKLQEMENTRDRYKKKLYDDISNKLTLFMRDKYEYLEKLRQNYFKSIYDVEPMANTINIQIASLLKLPQQYKLNSFIYENFKKCIDNSEFVINETSHKYYILDAFMQYICKYVTPVNRGEDSLKKYGVHNVFHAFTLNLMYIHPQQTDQNDLKKTTDNILRDVKLKFKEYYALAKDNIEEEDQDFIFDLQVDYKKTDTTQFIERIKLREDRSVKIEELREIFKMGVSSTGEDE
jgi:hypothetical protein